MAITDPSDDAGFEGITGTIRATAILFGIYIAMFLAVAGIVPVLTLRDAAAAIAPASSMAPAAAASSLRFGLAESPPSDSRSSGFTVAEPFISVGSLKQPSGKDGLDLGV